MAAAMDIDEEIQGSSSGDRAGKKRFEVKKVILGSLIFIAAADTNGFIDAGIRFSFDTPCNQFSRCFFCCFVPLNYDEYLILLSENKPRINYCCVFCSFI